MPVSTKVYGKGLLYSALNKEIDINSDTLKCALFTSGAAPNQDHQYFDAAPYTSGQLSGGGYSAQTLGSPSLTYTDATNTVAFDAGDVTFTDLTTSVSGLPRYAVIYDDTPASNKPLIAYVDFGQDESRTAQDLIVQFNAAGIFTVTAA